MIIFSQNAQIKEIKFQGKTAEENRYIEILNLKDKNALIIQIGYASYPIRGEQSDLIVYLNNGQLRLYKIAESVEAELDPNIKRVRINKDEYQRYWEFLNTCIIEEKFILDAAKLNLKDNEEATLALAISAGQTYHFRMYQNKKYTTYSCFAPKIHISLKTAGYEEKQRLVDLMEGFENMINKY